MTSRGVMIPVPGTFARTMMILVVGGGMVIAAASLNPADSQAQPAPAVLPIETVASETPAFLGTIEGGHYRIDVYVGRSGPLYTVHDLQGLLLAHLLSGDELRERFPALDPRAMSAQANTDSALDDLEPAANWPDHNAEDGDALREPLDTAPDLGEPIAPDATEPDEAAPPAEPGH